VRLPFEARQLSRRVLWPQSAKAAAARAPVPLWPLHLRPPLEQRAGADAAARIARRARRGEQTPSPQAKGRSSRASPGASPSSDCVTVSASRRLAGVPRPRK